MERMHESNSGSSSLEMKSLLLCGDAQFLGITRNVLSRFHVAPRIVDSCSSALAMIESQEFEVVIVDWREIEIPEFLLAVRRSKRNADCVLVAIVRDLLDLRQAFAAGVHFLIHKPASALQIERCLRAAYCATVARRRKQHREKVEIVASVRTRTQPFGEAMIVNLSEGGAGLKTSPQDFVEGVALSAGEEVDLRFRLPGGGDMLDLTAIVVWATTEACGLRFRRIPDAQRLCLEQWLTQCVERSLAHQCERLRAVCA